MDNYYYHRAILGYVSDKPLEYGFAKNMLTPSYHSRLQQLVTMIGNNEYMKKVIKNKYYQNEDIIGIYA